MSINTLTALAVARNTRPPTKSDSGEVTEDSTKKGEDATLPQLLVKQVPTGMVAAYTALTAGIVELIEEPTKKVPEPDEFLLYRWIAFGVLVVISMVLTYTSYRSKAATGARQPVAEVFGVGIAAAGWGLVVPESPLLAQLEGPEGTVFVLLLGFLATAINLAVAAQLKKPAT